MAILHIDPGLESLRTWLEWTTTKIKEVKKGGKSKIIYFLAGDTQSFKQMERPRRSEGTRDIERILLGKYGLITTFRNILVQGSIHLSQRYAQQISCRALLRQVLRVCVVLYSAKQINLSMVSENHWSMWFLHGTIKWLQFFLNLLTKHLLMW